MSDPFGALAIQRRDDIGKFDGSQWNPKQVSDLVGFFNASDYGARGNGTVDDSAALLRLVAAANTTGKPSVAYLPPGTYIYDSPLILNDHVALRGSGPGITILKRKANSTQNHLITLAGIGCQLRDLTLDGNYPNVSSGSIVSEVNVGSGDSCLVDNIAMKNYLVYGIVVGSDSNCRITNSVFTGQASASAVTSIAIVGSVASTDLLIQGCKFTGHQLGAVAIEGTYRILGNMFSGNQVKASPGGGQLSPGTTGGTENGGIIAHNHIFASGGTESIGIEVSASTRGLIISDNVIETNQWQGIFLHSDCANVTITGNVIRNNSQASAGSRDGILIQGTAHTVHSNKCYDDQGTQTQGYGITLDTGLTHSFVSGNDFQGNKTGSIRDTAASSTNVVYGNNPDGWISQTFSAGDYTANGGGTWTLTSGDQGTLAYIIQGKMMTVAVNLVTTSVNAAGNTLNLAIPGGRIATKAMQWMLATVIDAGIRTTGWAEVAVSGTVIQFHRSDVASWSNATDTTYVQGVGSFEIN